MLLFFVACALAINPGAYLSIFGSDSNDGLTSMTPVKTLLRAYNVMSAQKWGIIYVMPGSYPLQSINIAGAFALIGSQSQPALTKFSCQQSQATLSTNGNAQFSFDSISFDGCANPLLLGASSSGYAVSVTMYNVLFNGNTNDLRVQAGSVSVYASNSMFSNGGIAVQQYKSYNYASTVSITFENVKFDSYSQTVLALSANGYYDVSQGALNLTNVKFTNGAAAYVRAGQNWQANINGAAFVGTTNSDCMAVFYNSAQVNINKSQFANKVGGPPLCVTGSAVVTVQTGDFSNNSVVQASFTSKDAAGAVYVNGGTFAVANSVFRSNTLDAGVGGGIHCVGSHLTVAQSTFQYNSAPNAGDASCDNCVLVAYSNTEYGTGGGSQSACAL